MTELFKHFYVGDDGDCRFLRGDADLFIVHACKSPCHSEGVGYKGNLDKKHPYYLTYQTKNDLYLNIIDADTPLPAEFGDPIFKKALDFIESKYNKSPYSKVLVHCNRGQSRSPSIALVFMAKKGEIDSISYDTATRDFKKLYPEYAPGKGIAHYLENNWAKLMDYQNPSSASSKTLSSLII